MLGQQIINALYLEKLNYGVYAKSLDGDALPRFLERMPHCQKALNAYSQDGNKVILEALDLLLVEAAKATGAVWDAVTVS